ncbi:MAG: hypothetical protein RMA76_22720 [Deltaproteobacteria bacterium]
MRVRHLLASILVLSACKAEPAKAPAEAPPAAPDTPAAQPASQPASQPDAPKGHAASQPKKRVEPEPAPPPVEPSADAPDPKSPYTFKPNAAGALCRYTYKQVVNEVLGGDFYAGTEIEVDYILRTQPLKAGLGFAFEAVAERVRMRGKRADVHTDLDSTRNSDLRRVEGGADATVEPDTVAWFALVDLPVKIHLDMRGRFERLDGGDEVRKRFMSLHPPHPRKSPFYIERAKLRMSDEAIAERFLPFAVHLFEKGNLDAGRKDKEEIEVLTPDHRARALRARRINHKGKKILFETRWGFAPSKAPHVVPKNPDANIQDFLGGEGSELVSFEADNPCFLQAAQTRSVAHSWRGLVDGESVATERKTVTTTIWRKL